MPIKKSNLFHAVVMVGCTMFGCGDAKMDGENGNAPTPASTGTPVDLSQPRAADPDLSPGASPEDLGEPQGDAATNDLGPDMRDHRDGFHPTK